MTRVDPARGTTIDDALRAMHASGALPADAEPTQPTAARVLPAPLPATRLRTGPHDHVHSLPLDRIGPTASGGLLLGALARNADTAYHSVVRERYPLLAAAILAGAPPQARNMASNGGNLLQRTRCFYFHDPAMPCNKREPGSGCPAQDGQHRMHAVLGGSVHCVATHPSDMAVALAALDAVVHVTGPQGARHIAIDALFRPPADRPDLDTTLAPGEMLTGIELPPQGFATHSAYVKLRDRQSPASTLLSVAAALELGVDGRIRQARVALGGVAHTPWRNRAAEASLVGHAPQRAVFEAMAGLVMAEAQDRGAQGFKIAMARRTVVRTLERAAGLAAATEPVH